MKLQYYVVTILSLVILQGSVCTQKMPVAVNSLIHTVQRYLLQLPAETYGSSLAAFNVIAKTFGILFVDTVFIISTLKKL